MASSAHAGGREQEGRSGAAVYSGGGIDGSSWSASMVSSVILLLFVALLSLPVALFFPRNRNPTKESALRSVAVLLAMVALAVGAGEVYRVGYGVGCTWLTLRLALALSLAGPAGSCDSSIDVDDAKCRLPSKQPHITSSDVDDDSSAPPPSRRLGIFFVRVIFLRLRSGGRSGMTGQGKMSEAKKQGVGLCATFSKRYFLALELCKRRLCQEPSVRRLTERQDP